MSNTDKTEERTSRSNNLSELRQTYTHTTEKKGDKVLSGLTAGMKRRIKRKLSGERPTIWIGKGGVSQELLKEIEKQLEKKEMVKIRILQSALGDDEAKQIASTIATQIDASLVEVRGHTAMLYKRRRK